MTPEVPPDERAELQRTAQAAGERMGGMKAVIAEHGEDLDKITESIAALAAKMAEYATTSAVMSRSLTTIERVLDTKMLSHESRLTVIEAWIAEKRGGSDVRRRDQAHSTQWWIAVFAGGIAVLGIVVAAVVSITVLLVSLAANGKLG